MREVPLSISEYDFVIKALSESLVSFSELSCLNMCCQDWPEVIFLRGWTNEASMISEIWTSSSRGPLAVALPLWKTPRKFQADRMTPWPAWPFAFPWTACLLRSHRRLSSPRTRGPTRDCSKSIWNSLRWLLNTLNQTSSLRSHRVFGFERCFYSIVDLAQGKLTSPLNWIAYWRETFGNRISST